MVKCLEPNDYLILDISGSIYLFESIPVVRCIGFRPVKTSERVTAHVRYASHAPQLRYCNYNVQSIVGITHMYAHVHIHAHTQAKK